MYKREWSVIQVKCQCKNVTRSRTKNIKEMFNCKNLLLIKKEQKTKKRINK